MTGRLLIEGAYPNGGPVEIFGTVGSTTAIPAAADLVGASRSTTGTLVTIPAGRVFRGSLALSSCVAVAGTSAPTISVSGTGVPAGTLHSITVNGLALLSVSSANTINDVHIYGGASGATVTFTAGASGTSTGQIAGRLL